MFIIAQIISLAVARYIPERFFCWAPYDEHTYINVNVEINGKQYVSFLSTGGNYHNYKNKSSTLYTFAIDNK